MIEIIQTILESHNFKVTFMHEYTTDFDDIVYLFEVAGKPNLILSIVLPNNACSMFDEEIEVLIKRQLPVRGDK